MTGPLAGPDGHALELKLTQADLQAARTEGTISSLRFTGNGDYEVYFAMAPSLAPVSEADILPGDPVAQGQWESIRSGHTLIPMHDGKVLDWVASGGTWRLWRYAG